MPELKELSEQIASTWEEMKSKTNEVLAESKTITEARAEDKETIGKMSAAIDETKKTLDDLGAKYERSKLEVPGSENATEESKAKKAAFFKFLRVGRKGLEPEERKALVEDTTGLYAVPEEIESEIIRAVPQYNVIRQMVASVTTSRDKLRKRTLTEVSMGWGKLETGTDITESNLVPATDYIYAEDLYGLSKIGEDELMDTDANLQAIIADSFAVAKANAEEAAFVIGTGHTYSQPVGIAVDTTLRTGLTTGCGVADSDTYGISWTTDDTVLIDDLLKCEYQLPSQYLNGSAWLMNRKTELAARILKEATTGGFLWQPSLMSGEPNNFDGYPVYNNGSMSYPADGLAQTNVVFGNFKMGYRIIDRMGMSIQRLDELYAEAGLVGFKAHFRVGGDIVRYPAFQIITNDD